MSKTEFEKKYGKDFKFHMQYKEGKNIPSMSDSLAKVYFKLI